MFRTVLINGGSSLTIHDTSANKRRKLVSGKIVREPNSIASYTFELYPDNVGYEAIHPLQTIVRVRNTAKGRDEFVGRVLKPLPEMDESGVVVKRVVCEDRLGYLNDSIQPYAPMKHYVGDSTRTGLEEFIDVVLGNHNARVEAHKQIYRGRVTVDPFKYSDAVTKQLSYQTTWATLKEKLVGSFGGYLILRESNGLLYLDYLAEEDVGVTRTTSIRRGHNMRSASRELDPSGIITRFYPLGAKLSIINEEGQEEQTEERVSIRSVNPTGEDYIEAADYLAEYGIIEGSWTWDDVTLPNNLYTKALSWLSDHNGIYSNNRITALDLSLLGIDPDDFALFDRYPVWNDLIELNDTLQIVKQVIDTVTPEESTFDMGDTVRRMSDVIADSQSPAAGEPGRSSYIHIRYSASASGENMTTTPDANTRYIGLCSTASPVAPTDYSLYTWSKYVGEDGRDGQNGRDGADGTSVTILGSYDSYADFIAAGLTGDAGDAYLVDGDLYVWSPDTSGWINVGTIQGPPGAAGSDGTSVTSTTPYYAKGLSPTVKPSDPSIPGWTVRAPSLSYGEYLWCSFRVTYSAGPDSWTEPFYLKSADDLTQAGTAPENPTTGTLWLDTSSEPYYLMRYDGEDWQIVADTTDLMNTVREQYQEYFGEYEDTIADLERRMTRVTTTTMDMGQVVEQMSTALNMGADGVSLEFQQVLQDVRDVKGAVESQSSTLESYIRFINGTIELGRKNAKTTLVLENDQLTFYQNGVSVAYFNAGKLFVRDVQVISSLQLGRYAFIPNDSGGMALKYIG